MANQHHPDKQARTYRLHRDLVARMQAEAAARGITEVDLVRTAVEEYLEGPCVGANAEAAPASFPTPFAPTPATAPPDAK